MAVCDACVFPGFLTPVLTPLSFQSHRLLFSHPSKVRDKNMPQKFAKTWQWTHKHKVMSPAHSLLSHLGRAVGRSNPYCTFIMKVLFLCYFSIWSPLHLQLTPSYFYSGTILTITPSISNGLKRQYFDWHPIVLAWIVRSITNLH